MTGIYFSGTGNTEYCLKRFMEHCGKSQRIFSIEDGETVKEIAGDSEIIFAYPIYYSNLPKIVRDYIDENAVLWMGKKIFIIVTMGLFSGDGSGVAARLFEKYGAAIAGGVHIKMPDCIGDVKLLKKSLKETREIFRAGGDKAENAARVYLSGDTPRDGLSFLSRILGFFGQRLFFYGKTKDYKSLPKIDVEKCIGCGLCAKICPMGNISVKEGRAISGNRCTMCYRCFSRCPKEAVTIIGKKVICQYRTESLK